MPTLTTPQLDALREALPDTAKDLRLNLSSVLQSEVMTAEQIVGCAAASAWFLRNEKLRQALLTDVQSAVPEAVLEDAAAAAGLMGMNTILYRFRHMVAKPSYGQRPARLRMQWMMSPKTSKGDFELFSLCCAALAGCEACIKAHEASVLKHGLSEEHVHEAIRIAAVMCGVAVALG